MGQPRGSHIMPQAGANASVDIARSVCGPCVVPLAPGAKGLIRAGECCAPSAGTDSPTQLCNRRLRSLGRQCRQMLPPSPQVARRFHVVGSRGSLRDADGSS
eukprot:7556947-Lingulodinium_polyedra.AAC.1